MTQRIDLNQEDSNLSRIASDCKDARQRYFKTKKDVEQLLDKAERIGEKLESLVSKRNIWSCFRFIYLSRRFTKFQLELETLGAILNMNLSRWESAVNRLLSPAFNREIFNEQEKTS